MAEDKPRFSFSDKVHGLKFSGALVVKVAIALGLIVLLAAMFPRGEAIELEYKIGAVWAQQDLYAPFSFPIHRDEKEYEREVEEAKASLYPVFERDATMTEKQRQQLDGFFGRLQETLNARAKLHASVKEQSSSVAADSLLFAKLSAQLEVKFYEREWELLAQLSGERLEEMRRVVVRSAETYLQNGILDVEKKTFTRSELALRKGTVEEILPVSNFYDQSEIVTLLGNDLVAFYKREHETADIAQKIGVLHLVPNVKLKEEATQLATTAAIESVPRTAGYVEEGDRIIGKNERITPEVKQKLDSLRKARLERGTAASGPFQYVGVFLHVAMVVTLFGIYLQLFRKRIFGNNRRLALVALLILLEGFFAYLTRVINIASPVEYLIFVPAASMLLTIIFDSRVGFYGTVIIAYLVAGIRGNDYAIALASLVAGALSVYTVRDVRNRTQIIRSLGFIFLGYAITIIALGFERIESFGVIVEELTYALANSIISPVLTFGLLIFFEKYFRVTTDLTLIELGHFNHPLLKMLSEKAPGTYHHSMTMANLAEAAASAVGANEVLARAGAYFHDIGKVEKPTYFVENQKGNRNRHEKLAPRMSSLIIQNHVKKGMALAREHSLPEEVVDFIPQHHGTTRIDFFYRKALTLAGNSSDETKIDEINEEDYRYPGPKPQTKETGILMLADSIEAAARSLEDPAPQKLEVLIDDLIKKRFEEGELDECPLTLKDLTKIKKAFLGVLVGVYHGRVKYPEVEKEKGQKAEDTEQPKQREQDSKQVASEQQAEPVPASSPSIDSDTVSAPSEERLSRTIKSIDNQ
ncbi:MAG: HDIG domain-containing metalloprotein [Bacteroidota bacterium]